MDPPPRLSRFNLPGNVVRRRRRGAKPIRSSGGAEAALYVSTIFQELALLEHYQESYSAKILCAPRAAAVRCRLVLRDLMGETTLSEARG